MVASTGLSDHQGRLSAPATHRFTAIDMARTSRAIIIVIIMIRNIIVHCE